MVGPLIITLQPFLLQFAPALAEAHPITTLHFSVQINEKIGC